MLAHCDKVLLIIIRTIPGLNSINLAADVAVGGGDGVLAVNEVEAWTRNMRQTEATCRARSMAKSGLKLPCFASSFLSWQMAAWFII